MFLMKIKKQKVFKIYIIEYLDITTELSTVENIYLLETIQEYSDALINKNYPTGNKNRIQTSVNNIYAGKYIDPYISTYAEVLNIENIKYNKYNIVIFLLEY